MESIAMNHHGEVSLRGTLQNSQQVTDFRSKLIGSGLFSTVSVDEQGKVSDAKATSIKGQNADLLIPEALKTARSFLFRPARSGEKPVRSQTDLNFIFAGHP